MTEAELAAVIVTVGIGTVLSNLILFGLMFKLYRVCKAADAGSEEAMTEAGWTHGKDLSAEGQSFMASVKVLIDAIEQEAYQQGRVEGLREAAIICRERGKPHDIQWWMTASKKEVSAQTAIDCAELIEQAAQDEKGVGE